MLKPLLRGVAELLAPSLCAGCELPSTAAQAALCDACSPLLERAPQALAPPQPAAAAFLFQGPLADAIRRFKYQDRPDLARGLGALLAEACEPYAGQIEYVVPMPLHPRKLRSRGYNPAALLARQVASALAVPLDCDLLQRVRDTPPQASLARAARETNVRGAFCVAAGTRSTGQVLLIDDVRTTGATSSEAARALCRAGQPVWSLALAWSPT